MKFASKLITSITPYTPGEQPQEKSYIKLNTNENPFPPSPKIKAFLENYDIGKLKLYPDPEAQSLRNTIARTYSLDAENVFIGNGSDEVLAFCFPSFFNAGDSIACYDITYSFYPVYAKFFGIEYKAVPLENLMPNVAAFENIRANGVLLANPNAPTGIALKRNEIEKIVKTNSDKIVIIDEAYIDFCHESVVDLIPVYPNLLVVQTLSKSYSLAGVRCGMALGHKDMIKTLNIAKHSFNSYTSSTLSQAIAQIAFADSAWHKECINKVTKVRDTVSQRLIEMGFEVLPSSANFLFIKVGEGKKYYLALKQKGILVRYFDTQKLCSYIRVTIGHFEQMAKFLEALQEIKEGK